jgi:hypothetical protein
MLKVKVTLAQYLLKSHNIYNHEFKTTHIGGPNK